MEARNDASKSALFELHKVLKFQGDFIPQIITPKCTSDRLKEKKFDSRAEAQFFLKSLDSSVAAFDSHTLATECKAVRVRTEK